MTDITELAQRNELLIANGQQTADLLRHLANNEIDSDYFAVVSECESYGKETDAELSITEFALRAAGYVDALVEALEKAQQRISELEEAEQKLCAANMTLDARAEQAERERENWRTSFDNERFRADKLKAHIDDIEPIRAAAEKLVRCKGRYHSEMNYRTLAALFGVTTPDLPPLDGESRTVKLPPELYTIGELIRTQDNRITDQPMFVVFQKREIIGSDEHSPSRICWVWDGEEVSELRAKRLEALYQDGRDTRRYDRYAMQEVDEFVTACFTEHGCKDYLRQNAHNLRLPYIYACGSFRNNEYQLVRNWLAGIKWEAE
ncbi:hypothetical protein ACF8O5_18685 [Raoultella sp. TYF_8]|uniref:hypothetical protein n=1 Tax=Raoultella sp. TYF_8 TaxID=3367188 RepID=UPI00370BA5B0